MEIDDTLVIKREPEYRTMGRIGKPTLIDKIAVTMAVIGMIILMSIFWYYVL